MIEKENDMTIDTLQIYERLRSSSLPDEAAKGIRKFMALMFTLEVVVVAALMKLL